MRDQAHRLRELAARTRTTELREGGPTLRRILAVTSGKGGVGKTNVVANLGAALARRKRTVTVLDADFGLANLDILLNLNPPKNLSHLFRGEARAEDVLVQVEPGFRVIPGASGVEELAEMEDRERRGLLGALATLTDGEDFVLIDTAAGIGRNVVELCLAAGEVILVTNAEPTSLTDAYGLLKVLRARDPHLVIRLLVNSAASPGEGRSVHARLREVVERFLGGGLEYLGHVARDECVGRAALRQVPFVRAYPRSSAARCIEAAADALIDGGGPSRAPRDFWTRLLGADGGAGR